MLSSICHVIEVPFSHFWASFGWGWKFLMKLIVYSVPCPSFIHTLCKWHVDSKLIYTATLDIWLIYDSKGCLKRLGGWVGSLKTPYLPRLVPAGRKSRRVHWLKAPKCILTEGPWLNAGPTCTRGDWAKGSGPPGFIKISELFSLEFGPQKLII